MALKDHVLPTTVNYEKLANYPDGEKIPIYGVGISDGGRYGEQPYLLADDDNNTRISIPVRYLDYIMEIMEDDEALKELKDGVIVLKNSYEYEQDKYTPTFTFI